MNYPHIDQEENMVPLTDHVRLSNAYSNLKDHHVKLKGLYKQLLEYVHELKDEIENKKECIREHEKINGNYKKQLGILQEAHNHNKALLESYRKKYG